MAEYIEREAFKQKYLCCGYLPEMSEKEFDEFPTADVAPVVRCKDCKYNRGSKKCLNPDSFFAVPKDDDFCSYGERKNGGDSDAAN